MKSKPDFSLISKHWLLKLLSLVIGTSLWYFVAAEDRLDLTVTLPLELRNLPANLVVANQYRKEIEVTISGPRRLIQEMRQQNISRPVDLGKAEPGPIVVKNDAGAIPLPRGISVQRVQPANITLLIDRLAHKDFTITPVTKGKPTAGFNLERLTLKPEKITVTGPQTILDKEEALKTLPINLEGIDRSTTLQAHLNLSETLLKLIGETVVEATVAIKETMIRKHVRGIAIINREQGGPGRFSPATVAVDAEIPERIVQTTPELTNLFRATAGPLLEKNGHEVQVLVHSITPPGHTPIIIYTITPDKARLLP